MLSIHKVSMGPSNTTHFRSGVSDKANSLKVLATIPSVHWGRKRVGKLSLQDYKVIIRKHFKFLGLKYIVNTKIYCRLPHETLGQIVQKVGP